jgi:hypothetical protein
MNHPVELILGAGGQVLLHHRRPIFNNHVESEVRHFAMSVQVLAGSTTVGLSWQSLTQMLLLQSSGVKRSENNPYIRMSDMCLQGIIFIGSLLAPTFLVLCARIIGGNLTAVATATVAQQGAGIRKDVHPGIIKSQANGARLRKYNGGLGLPCPQKVELLQRAENRPHWRMVRQNNNEKRTQ